MYVLRRNGDPPANRRGACEPLRLLSFYIAPLFGPLQAIFVHGAPKLRPKCDQSMLNMIPMRAPNFFFEVLRTRVSVSLSVSLSGPHGKAELMCLTCNSPPAALQFLLLFPQTARQSRGLHCISQNGGDSTKKWCVLLCPLPHLSPSPFGHPHQKATQLLCSAVHPVNAPCHFPWAS